MLTWPEMQNNFVPLLFSRPKESNQDAPLRIIVGATATVSTLVTVVGHPYKPHWAGKGGFNLGFPIINIYIQEIDKDVIELVVWFVNR